MAPSYLYSENFVWANMQGVLKEWIDAQGTTFFTGLAEKGGPMLHPPGGVILMDISQ